LGVYRGCVPFDRRRYTLPILKRGLEEAIGVRSIDADVVIEVKVSVEGKVEEAQITETGGSDLDSAALAAVKKWAFESAKPPRNCRNQRSHQLAPFVREGSRVSE